MLPPGIILIGIIGLSGVLAAFVGAALGKRMLGNTGSSIEWNEKFAPPTGILP